MSEEAFEVLFVGARFDGFQHLLAVCIVSNRALTVEIVVVGDIAVN
jgi:hypothetical protein